MSMRLVILLGVAAVFLTESSYARSQGSEAAGVDRNLAGSASVPDARPGSAALAAGQDTAAPKAKTVTVPAGTAIPLTLVSQIESRSTKPGDTVHAMVAFPVTTGTQLAIPAGTYVEGSVTRIAPNTLRNKLPQVEIHFIRMLFANGYAVDLNANSTQARTQEPADKAPSRESAWSAPQSTEQQTGSFAFTGQPIPGEPTTPTLPPMNHPNFGAIAATMGAGAALGIGMLVWAHHRAAHMDYVLFDSGWQFQMVLTKPLTLDASQVNAAASTPRVQ